MPGTFEQPQGPTPVIDSIANKVLGDIYNYLRTQSGADDTTDAVEELAAEQKKANQRQEVRSKAAESNDRAVQNALRGISNNQSTGLKNESIASRNRAIQNALLGKINSNEGKAVKSLAADSKNRAVQNALLGDVNKGIKDTNKGLNKLKDGIKQAMSGLKDFLTPFINKSLTHYTTFAKSLRMQNLTSEQKQKIGVATDQAFLDTKSLYGINVAKEDVAKFFEEMTAGGKDVELMNNQQRAAYAALRQRGLDDEKAYNIAMSGNHQAIAKMINEAGDPKRRALITQTINGLQDYELSVGDFNKNLNMITDASAAAAENFGATAIGVGKLDGVMKQSFLGATGQFEKLEGDAAAAMGHISNDMSENIKSQRKFAENMNEVQRRALGPESDFLNNMANVSANIETMSKNGSATKMGVRSSKDNARASAENTTNGKLQDIIDSSVTKFNLATGGSLTALGTTLDKWLGDSADINSLVRNGFKLVIGTLKTIALNTSGVGKALLGLGGAAAIIALVANWDKIKPKLAPLLDAIKEVASDIISNLPSFITDAISGIKNAFSDIFKGGLFSGAGSSISGAAGSLAGAVSGADMGQSVKEMGSSLGSMFGSIFDWIKEALPGVGSILHDIIGCIDNAITSVAPALSDICDVLHAAVDGIVALGISIVDCIREIGVAVVDCVKEVLVAIAPAINSIAHAIEVLCEALAPVVPTIVEMIKFAVETILPPLVNKLVPRLLDLFEKVVQNILPPLLEIIKKAVEIVLPPMMDILKKVAETLLPPISEAISVIVGLVDRIVNLVLDILEPPLRAISEAISSIIEIVTSVANFVKDIVNFVHGLFNYLTSKLPDLIGWISGIFDWISNDIFPIVKSGFNVLYNIVNTFYEGIKSIIITAIWPIKKVVDAVDFGIKLVRLAILNLASHFVDNWEERVRANQELEESRAILEGHDATEETERLRQVWQDAIAANYNGQGADSHEAVTAFNEYMNALKQDGSIRERQNEKTKNALNDLGNAVDEFKGNFNKAINNGGPRINEASKEDFTQYLTGQKGNIASENVLPPNTGSLLDSITSGVDKTLEVITSIHSVIVEYIKANKNIPAYGDGTQDGPITRSTKIIAGDKGPEHLLPTRNVSAAKGVLSKFTDKERDILSTAMSETESSAEYQKAADALSKWTGGRMKPAEFFALFGPIAREDMRTTGIPASVTLAQAALESGWGKTAKAEFKNLFGIKGKGNAGSAVVNTHEVYDGVRVQKKDAFAQYLTYLDSITAHSDYLLNAKRKKGLEGLRYGEALTHIFEPNLFAYLLREGGYATSTAYGKKLVNVMKGHNLYKWDVSNLSLKNVGSVQSKLYAKAKENLSSAAASNERMSSLLNEEHTREVERAIKEGKTPPKAVATFLANGGSLTSAMVGQTSDQAATMAVNTASRMASMMDAVDTAEATYNELAQLPENTPLEQLRNLSNLALDSVKKSFTGEGWYRTKEASSKISSSSDSREILTCLSEIVRYLRSITTNTNKKQPIVGARPAIAQTSGTP